MREPSLPRCVSCGFLLACSGSSLTLIVSSSLHTPRLSSRLPLARRLSISLPSTTDYINDGVYGAFNCTLFDHQVVHPKVLTLNEEFQDPERVWESTEECSVWGPTCDSIDVVQQAAQLPVNVLSVGDWLRWENMGAYTICAASQVSWPSCPDF